MLDGLSQIESDSVHCVVTSPPYWGLRDYGTASWAGGDKGCDHIAGRGGHLRDSVTSTRGGANKVEQAQAIPYRDLCGKCGATRIDNQIGLEKTPELYVEKMVAVFREVRRVLRNDGTVWLNLGSSYAGSMKGYSPNGYSYGGPKQRTNAGSLGLPPASFVRGKNPNQSLSLSRAPSCGSDDKESQSYPATDYACFDLCDECSRALKNRTDYKPSRPLSFLSSDETDHDSERSDCVSAVAGDAAPCAQESTKQQSSPQSQDECSHCANCGVCLNVLRSSERDASLCARRGEHSGDRVSRAQTLIRRIADKEPSGLASIYSTIASQGYKAKDLVDIPKMVAEALRLDGWWLRSDIIWSKPNPMPESVTDRPTKAHEYIFLLTKSERYNFDQDAVREPASENTHSPGTNSVPKQNGVAGGLGIKANVTFQTPIRPSNRNIRTVWEIATQPYPDAHFATFPEEIAKRCIMAGSKADNIVLDPFAGSGTVGAVALELGRRAILIELNPEYCKLIDRRTQVTYGMQF